MSTPRTTVFSLVTLSLATLMTLVTLSVAACGSSPAPSPAARPTSASSPVSSGAPASSGAPVAAGEARCPGWPSAPAGRLPRSFQAASVLRCVTETVSVPGRGRWTAAVLEKADQGLEPLTGALGSVSGHMEPGRMCPQFVIVPPQIVLVGKDGTRIRPTFPVTGCGQIQQKVTSALASLHWQSVSRRLLAKAPSVP